MIYKTIDEWIKHNPNHRGLLPIEVCHQIWGTKDNEKPWVGLTDDERYKLWLTTPSETEDRFAFAKAIEQALKERNT